jgi:hypothetical protein
LSAGSDIGEKVSLSPNVIGDTSIVGKVAQGCEVQTEDRFGTRRASCGSSFFREKPL